MIFFLTSHVRGAFHKKDFKWKKIWDTRLISEKTEVLYATLELNERLEAATGSYSVIGKYLQYIYSVPVTENHPNIQSRCLIYESLFKVFFNDISHGYRTAISSLWLLPFYTIVATYFYDEIVRRMMCTAIVSNLLNFLCVFLCSCFCCQWVCFIIST